MMNAARGIFLAARRNRKPTAKSYVQDGLVAMWDGIENAGWGVHDPNATTWVDLIGTRDCTVSSGGTFLAKALHKPISAGTTAAATCSGRLFFSTWEYCFALGNVGVNPRIKNGRYGVCILVNPYDGAVYCGGDAQGTGYTVPPNMSISQGVTISYCSGTTHINGIVAEHNGLSKSYSGYGDALQFLQGVLEADLFCVRGYSRALTTDEITANYAVDKARFNLP